MANIVAWMYGDEQVRLAECASHTRHMEFECKRCGRYGRYRVANLFAKYGNVTMFELLDAIGSTCARR